jgi:CRP-like cAMP-binding protein
MYYKKDNKQKKNYNFNYKFCMDSPQKKINDMKSKKILKILTTEKDLRTASDLEFLYHEYKHFDFIRSLYENQSNGDLLSTNLLKCMMYRDFKKNDLLFRYGDNPSYCYVILKGSIDKLVPYTLPNETINSEISLMSNETLSKNLKHSPSKRLSLSITDCISEGQIIGDKEILQRSRRLFTAKCKTNCILGEISKIDYLNIMENTKKLESNEEVKFYNSVNLLRDCHKVVIEKFQSLFERKAYNKGESVILQGSPYDRIFIVRKGSFEISYKHSTSISSEYDINFFLKLNEFEQKRFTASRVYELKPQYKKEEENKVKYKFNIIVNDHWARRIFWGLRIKK